MAGRRRLGPLRVLVGVPNVAADPLPLAWCCLWDRPGEAREREAPWVQHARSKLAPRTRWSESAVL